MPSRSDHLRPRLCVLEKGDNGYGFHLHGEKGRQGQFIRLVEADSPSEGSGLRAGDRLCFVNGEPVEGESHQQVVQRIRSATAGRLELVVVDAETDALLKRHGLRCRREYVTEGVPLPVEDDGSEDEEERVDEDLMIMDGEVEEEEELLQRAEEDNNGMMKEVVVVGTPTGEEGSPCITPVPLPRGSLHSVEENGNGEVIIHHDHVRVEKKLSAGSEKEVSCELRPRLCVIQRGSSGYGFNLHSEKARPGQYIRAVDPSSPAERAGLQPRDRIVQVNGVPVEGRNHSDVVAAIKSGGDETRLLVVDPETDAFFKRCRVAPTPDHLTGPLPEPLINGDMEDKVNGRVAKETEGDSKLSVSPSPSNASSNTSLTTPPINTTPEESEQTPGDAIPALTLTLQQVKERAHQKRSNKRAPPMDWTKKNELFSNL